MPRTAPTAPAPRHRRQRGATLIEALVAITIFSFGILAVIGMLATHTATANDARFRVEASQYAESILSEMRLYNANSRGADFSEGGTRYEAWTERISGAGGLPLVGVGDDTPPLSITQNAGTVTITIRWLAGAEATRAARDAGQATPHQYVLTSFVD